MLAESRNCGPGSGVVGLVDEPPPKDDKKTIRSGFLNHCNGAEGFSANTDTFVRQRGDWGKPQYPSHP